MVAKKYLAVAVISLLIGIAVAPSINANVNRNTTNLFSKIDNNKTVKLRICEYKADGTIEKNIVKLSYEKFKELKAELQTVNNIEERLSIFKDYNLIPQHVTLQQLKEDMEKKAQIMGLNVVEIEEKIRRFLGGPYKAKNFNCSLYGDYLWGFKLLFGTSPIMALINRWFFKIGEIGLPTFPYLSSRDSLQLHEVFSVSVETENGTLPDLHVDGIFGRVIIANFVGYYISFVPIIPSFFITSHDKFVGYVSYIGVRWSTIEI